MTPPPRRVVAPCVYPMRMARVNVYLPDDLAERVRAAGLNVSGITQDALRTELARLDTTVWLDAVAALPAAGISHEEALAALDAARDEFGA